MLAQLLVLNKLTVFRKTSGCTPEDSVFGLSLLVSLCLQEDRLARSFLANARQNIDADSSLVPSSPSCQNLRETAGSLQSNSCALNTVRLQVSRDWTSAGTQVEATVATADVLLHCRLPLPVAGSRLCSNCSMLRNSKGLQLQQPCSLLLQKAFAAQTLPWQDPKH